MTSYAIVYRLGLEDCVARAKAAGVAGMIVPDRWSSDGWPPFAARRISAHPAVTPTNPLGPRPRIADKTTGFIYVSVTGSPGARGASRNRRPRGRVAFLTDFDLHRVHARNTSECSPPWPTA